jgi:HSP20 family molecular chaperone IbpA
MNTETLNTESTDLTPAVEAKPEVTRWHRPAVDVLESEEALQLHVDMPGVAPPDLTVETHRGVLTVSAVRSNGVGYKRTFRVPDTVDAEGITASLEHGVLVLTLPRAEAAKPRTIEVR